jgi:hypothetical protein
MMSLDDVSPATQPASVDVRALDQAPAALASIDARQSHAVELRFFSGLNIDEAAEAPGDVARHGRARMGFGEGLALSAAVAAAVTPVGALGT